MEATPVSLDEALESARQLTRSAKLDDALQAWEQVEQLDPGNAEAAGTWAALTIERSRRRHGLGGDGSRWVAQVPGSTSAEPDGILPAKTTALILSEIARLNGDVQRTPIQQLELAVRERPSIPELYLQLTQLYLESGRDYDAERLLMKGRDATDDPRVRRLWEDVTLLRLDKKIDLAANQLEAEDSPEARLTLEKLRSERERTETDFFFARTKAEPNNAEVHYQFGQRLRRSGKIEEAAGHLERALHDITWRSPAAYELAECQRQADRHAEALRNYRLAVESALPEQREFKKQSLYKSAALAARMKLFRLAERYISELLRIDPEYKDAAAFLEAVKQQVI